MEIKNLREIRSVSFPVCQAHKTFNKVFGVGANKTGTTTLRAVFEVIGLKVANQQEGEMAGMPFYRGHFGALKDFIEKYDAFQDLPFSVKYTFAQVDALFPNSKFILTHREPNEWFNSLLSFHKKIFMCAPGAAKPTREDIKRFTYIYPEYLEEIQEMMWLLKVDTDLAVRKDWSLNYNKSHYIDSYVQRNMSVVRHFSERPDDLLVIDITRELTTRKIVEFLGLPLRLVTEMPHLNQT